MLICIHMGQNTIIQMIRIKLKWSFKLRTLLSWKTLLGFIKGNCPGLSQSDICEDEEYNAKVFHNNHAFEKRNRESSVPVYFYDFFFNSMQRPQGVSQFIRKFGANFVLIGNHTGWHHIANSWLMTHAVWLQRLVFLLWTSAKHFWGKLLWLWMNSWKWELLMLLWTPVAHFSGKPGSLINWIMKMNILCFHSDIIIWDWIVYHLYAAWYALFKATR